MLVVTPFNLRSGFWELNGGLSIPRFAKDFATVLDYKLLINYGEWNVNIRSETDDPYKIELFLFYVKDASMIGNKVQSLMVKDIAWNPKMIEDASDMFYMTKWSRTFTAKRDIRSFKFRIKPQLVDPETWLKDQRYWPYLFVCVNGNPNVIEPGKDDNYYKNDVEISTEFNIKFTKVQERNLVACTEEEVLREKTGSQAKKRKMESPETQVEGPDSSSDPEMDRIREITHAIDRPVDLREDTWPIRMTAADRDMLMRTYTNPIEWYNMAQVNLPKFMNYIQTKMAGVTPSPEQIGEGLAKAMLKQIQ